MPVLLAVLLGMQLLSGGRWWSGDLGTFSRPNPLLAVSDPSPTCIKSQILTVTNFLKTIDEAYLRERYPLEGIPDHHWAHICIQSLAVCLWTAGGNQSILNVAPNTGCPVVWCWHISCYWCEPFASSPLLICRCHPPANPAVLVLCGKVWKTSGLMPSHWSAQGSGGLGGGGRWVMQPVVERY